MDFQFQDNVPKQVHSIVVNQIKIIFAQHYIKVPLIDINLLSTAHLPVKPILNESLHHRLVQQRGQAVYKVILKIKQCNNSDVLSGDS